MEIKYITALKNSEDLDDIGCLISLPNEFDHFKWKVVFIGLNNNPYHVGFFRMDINYPVIILNKSLKSILQIEYFIQILILILYTYE